MEETMHLCKPPDKKTCMSDHIKHAKNGCGGLYEGNVKKLATGQEVYVVDGHMGNITVAGYVKKVAVLRQLRGWCLWRGLAGCERSGPEDSVSRERDTVVVAKATQQHEEH